MEQMNGGGSCPFSQGAGNTSRIYPVSLVLVLIVSETIFQAERTGKAEGKFFSGRGKTPLIQAAFFETNRLIIEYECILNQNLLKSKGKNGYCGNQGCSNL
ncbi:MAG: hypothetical protein GC205_13515 [Bacteroidetes bacterium]|nr:hypothetical protein [Bacteroidota bacterium]